MWEYTDKVKEHFLNPKNVGEIETLTVLLRLAQLLVVML